MNTPVWRRLSKTTGVAVVAAALAFTAACSSGESTESSGYTGAVGPVDLSANCPDKVVIQTDWNPEAEHGHLYQLLGPDPTINAGNKRVVGPLFDRGEYTGVDIEIRAGGPAIGFQSVTSQMYSDPEILLGYVDTDQAIQNSKDNPTTAVMAPLDISPQMIMWDPATYPQVQGIADLKAANARVLYFEGATYMDYLTGSGVLSPAQVDGSYDGSPANFVSDGGKTAQQGFASSEPQVYQEEVEGWQKPVKYQLIHDVGFPSYKSSVAVRSDALEENAACLEQLVPVLQRGSVDYLASPQAADAVILDAVEQYDTGWVYSQRNADYARETMADLNLVSNGTDTTIGNFDTARVARVMEVTGPIFTEQGTPAADGLTPEAIATNRFIDTSVGLPS
ncbi:MULTISPECIES: nitrate ABC transporter substrate-binding protein [unclassified Gordonia (in: high G+C Gram-positive bacteria)]|uniref:nitrate ABC transporter substrate-binding protein n=1 Tax=Gordonia TaxID=2053 RepID=UPI000990F7D7|nr:MULTISPECIES: nitrate ABC transporter substrate-binding protein [unclassified Gordonia (in: high G+C Gram-positive bacteria)]MBR7193402.1 ABC transporter substrate-binding protein [Gordonia sp. SCSIO 19800]MCX2753839.1 ABC transporter substrate-binding protein [Gordonia sp. 4N]MDT0220928.1 ABC transporter substrate-binding protein [Gordonia sp. AC31]